MKEIQRRGVSREAAKDTNKKYLGICAGVEYTPTKTPKRFSVNQWKRAGCVESMYLNVRVNPFCDFTEWRTGHSVKSQNIVFYLDFFHFLNQW
ncbi:MAG: hypothetical protein WCS52_13195 [bacterium]